MIRMPQAASQPQTWRGFEAGPPIIAGQIVGGRTRAARPSAGISRVTTQLSGAASPMSTRSDSIKSAMNPAKGISMELEFASFVAVEPVTSEG